MTTKDKIVTCPLKWIGYLANTDDDMRPDLLICDGPDCKWWDWEAAECATVSAAKSLYHLSIGLYIKEG